MAGRPLLTRLRLGSSDVAAKVGVYRLLACRVVGVLPSRRARFTNACRVSALDCLSYRESDTALFTSAVSG